MVRRLVNQSVEVDHHQLVAAEVRRPPLQLRVVDPVGETREVASPASLARAVSCPHTARMLERLAI